MLDKKLEVHIVKMIILIFIIVVAIVICYLLYVNIVKRNIKECAVKVLEDESFLNEFEVINNEVHIYCVVSLKNNSNNIKKVKLIGNFQKEVENGLLKNGSLEANFIEGTANSIIVKENSTVKYIEVEFVGEYAGNPSMSNRNLPYIEVIEIE